MDTPHSTPDPVLIPPQDVPVIDAEQVELLQCAAADAGPEFCQDLIDTFTSEIEPRFALIEEACRNKDAGALRKHIHFFSGSSANIGLSRHSQFCKSLEVLLDEDSFYAWDGCLEAIQSSYEASINALRGRIFAS